MLFTSSFKVELKMNKDNSLKLPHIKVLESRIRCVTDLANYCDWTIFLTTLFTLIHKLHAFFKLSSTLFCCLPHPPYSCLTRFLGWAYGKTQDRWPPTPAILTSLSFPKETDSHKPANFIIIYIKDGILVVSNCLIIHFIWF